MVTRIVIPQAFENMEEATIGAWHKAPGEAVAVGDNLCELITEKTTFDLPAEIDGVLRRIVAPEKSIVPVGYVIALIGQADETLPDVSGENAAVLARKSERADAESGTLNVPSSPPPATGAPVAGGGSGSRLRATPAARRAAREQGVDLEAVAAAFPGKVLSEDDVLKFKG